jgi:hypothetical protein
MDSADYERMVETCMNVSDHPGRAEELMAMITADGHPDLQLTAPAAVAEEVLAVADEVAGLRELLTVKPSPGPGSPSVPSPERGGPSAPFGVIGELPWSPGRPPEGWVRNYRTGM